VYIDVESQNLKIYSEILLMIQTHKRKLIMSGE